LRGCAAIYNQRDRIAALKQFPVNGVWGIGRRLSGRLNALGIKTAWNLSQQQPRLMRKQFGVTMERTIRELNGESCFKLDEQPPPKQQIFSTKSFGERIYELSELQEAVSSFASKAMEKLRGQKSLVSTALVFIQTSRFDELHYSRSQVVKLPHPTNDTRHLVQHIRKAVADIFTPGLPYNKAGVGLIEISSSDHQQLSLINDQQSFKSQQLMEAVDAINQKMPKSVFLASNGTKQVWCMQRNKLSPAYTTRWQDLPRVK
jgi:DNA polymerase V